MYGTLLRTFEATKEDLDILRRRYDDLAASHSAAMAKLDLSQVRKQYLLKASTPFPPLPLSSCLYQSSHGHAL